MCHENQKIQYHNGQGLSSAWLGRSHRFLRSLGAPAHDPLNASSRSGSDCEVLSLVMTVWQLAKPSLDVVSGLGVSRPGLRPARLRLWAPQSFRDVRSEK